MRRLSVSLLIVVLLATIGFGWALDRLFFGLQPEEADHLAPYKVMGKALARSAAAGADLNTLVSAWPLEARVQLNTLSYTDLALPQTMQDDYERGEVLAFEADNEVMLMIPITGQETALTLALPHASNSETAVRFFLTLFFYAGIILLILLWVYPLVRRLHAMSKAAKAFGSGNFAARIPPARFSLIENIENEFNAMADRISILVEDNRLLSTAVSHDLRTPIARLRFGIDALSEEDDVAVQERYMQRISADLAEMEHLVEVLLDYARLEKQKTELPLQAMPLIPRVTDRINALSDDVTHQIEWAAPLHPVYVMANERYIDMVINNVLQNALRYGKSHVRISIGFNEKKSGKSLSQRVGQRHELQNSPTVCLLIEDDGPGIPIEERERVLKPFERGVANTERVRPNANTEGASKTMVSSGFGMGLAIVKRIIDWHGGQLELDTSHALGGAAIRLYFRPAEPDDTLQADVGTEQVTL